MNVTKMELTNYVSNKTGLTQVDTQIILMSLLKLIREKLCEGKKVEIRGFACFSVKIQKPRPCRNPKTGEKIWWPGGPKVHVKFFKGIKNSMNHIFNSNR